MKIDKKLQKEMEEKFKKMTPKEREDYLVNMITSKLYGEGVK